MQSLERIIASGKPFSQLYFIDFLFLLCKQSTEPSCPDEDGIYTVNNQCAREYYYCQGGVFIYEQVSHKHNMLFYDM